MEKVYLASTIESDGGLYGSVNLSLDAAKAAVEARYKAKTGHTEVDMHWVEVKGRWLWVPGFVYADDEFIEVKNHTPNNELMDVCINAMPVEAGWSHIY